VLFPFSLEYFFKQSSTCSVLPFFKTAKNGYTTFPDFPLIILPSTCAEIKSLPPMRSYGRVSPSRNAKRTPPPWNFSSFPPDSWLDVGFLLPLFVLLARFLTPPPGRLRLRTLLDHRRRSFHPTSSLLSPPPFFSLDFLPRLLEQVDRFFSAIMAPIFSYVAQLFFCLFFLPPAASWSKDRLSPDGVVPFLSFPLFIQSPFRVVCAISFGNRWSLFSVKHSFFFSLSFFLEGTVAFSGRRWRPLFSPKSDESPSSTTRKDVVLTFFSEYISATFPVLLPYPGPSPL